MNWETLELGKHYPIYFEISQLPVAYNPNAKDPVFEHYLETTIGDQETILMLEEFLGYCLIPYTRLEKMLILTGEGSNGKSVFIDVVSWLIGAENRCSIAWHDLEENRFAVANLVGKLVNLCGDIDSRAMRYSNSMKRLVTGDTVTAERKNEHSFEFKNYAKFIFSTNDLPPSNDKTKGFYRRILIVPFAREFVSKNPQGDQRLKDNNLRVKLLQELPGIFNRALRGLQRLIIKNNKNFTDSELVNDALFMYQCDNNTIMAFGIDQLRESPGALIPKKELYKQYVIWCRDPARKLQPEPEQKYKFFRDSLIKACPWIREKRLNDGSWASVNVTQGGVV